MLVTPAARQVRRVYERNSRTRAVFDIPPVTEYYLKNNSEIAVSMVALPSSDGGVFEQNSIPVGTTLGCPAPGKFVVNRSQPGKTLIFY
jgi:hypothetical protein